MTEADAVEIVGHVLEGFGSGDVATIGPWLHADVRAEFPFAPAGMPAVCEGHEAVMTAFREGRAGFARMKLTAGNTYWCADKETLLFEATSDGLLTHGTEYRNRYVFVIEFRDGLLSLWREYFNSLVVVHALEAEAAAQG